MLGKDSHNLETVLDLDYYEYKPITKYGWDQDLFWIKIYITENIEYLKIGKKHYSYFK